MMLYRRHAPGLVLLAGGRRRVSPSGRRLLVINVLKYSSERYQRLARDPLRRHLDTGYQTHRPVALRHRQRRA
jgi:hypothetical protein